MQILVSSIIAALMALPYATYAAPHGTHQKKADGFFKSAAASFYQVGSDIPGFGFKTPISWAGLMPLEHNYELTVKSIEAMYSEETAQSYFYWLWRAEVPSDDLVLWLTGGPGCSSLNAMFTENGPIEFNDVRQGPKPAKYSWTKHAHMIFLDQPGNTGFSKFKSATYNTGLDISADIYRFMVNFFRVYPELQGKKFWVAGESYAGTYVPNTVDYFYKQAAGSYNLQGSLIINGLITSRPVQQGVTVYKDAQGFQKAANISDKDLSVIKKESDDCGWTQYTEKYSQYPAVKGPYPEVPRTEDCKAYDAYANALENGNPFLDPYDVRYRGTEEYFEHSPFGNPNARPVPVSHFFSKPALQAYIHAPRRNFTLCDSSFIDLPAPFLDWDEVHKPVDRTLPFSVAKSVRTIVAHGRFDGLLLQHGLQIALQNMTWLGEQGFPRGPTTPFLDIQGRPSGFYTHIRKLSQVIVDRSGHMIPGDNAAAGMLLLQAMLGHRRLDGSPLIVEEE